MRVAVGISGGVDSAVAALRLRDAGHEVVGVTMTLGRANEAQSLAEAREVAARIELPLEILDLSRDWRESVVAYLSSEYLSGRTPNPCIRCNEVVKFGLLPRWCFEQLGCECFATGHYARVWADSRGVHLLRAIDHTKDQSYFLYRVAPEILARTIFPLGELTKEEVRAIASSRGLTVASKGDSQDFCGGEVKTFIAAEPREGEIVTMEGKVIGRHHGIWNYTVGMRKGLGIGGGTPYYVLELDAASNRVIVGFKDATVVREFRLREVVGSVDVKFPVKVRSAGEPKLLAEGLTGVAPGQSAVFFDGDEIVGGGIIAGVVR